MSGMIENGLHLSDNAKALHSQMMSKGIGALYTQQELQKQMGIESLTDLMSIVQELLDKNLIKLVKQNDELKFQGVLESEAQKKATMSAEEALVYSYIEASGREGIWSKTIKARTNLHQHVVLKCLKSLESQRYVKSVKSVKFPTRKIYMLYSLQPSVDITGGPWFTDGELDIEFINSLLTIVWRFISENTFPNGFKNFENGPNRNVFYAPNVKNYSTTQEILDFITAAQVANVELTPSNIRSLCEVLMYDDKLEKVTHDCYRVTLESILQMNQGESEMEAGNQASEDEEEFSIFNYYKMFPASKHDKEVVYFDEWTI